MSQRSTAAALTGGFAAEWRRVQAAGALSGNGAAAPMRGSVLLTADGRGWTQRLVSEIIKGAFFSGPDLSVWRPWAGSLLEAPTHPQML